jgi:hypothetical protein
MNFAGMMLLFLTGSPARADQNWELCLDRAEFTYNFDANLLAGTTTSASKPKDSCVITLSVSGGKGEMYKVDVCDRNIHVDVYDTFDSVPHHVAAGPAGCPAPLFGADFDENAREAGEFKEKRDRALAIWRQIYESYGEGAAKVDIGKAENFKPELSAAKVACGEFLLREYLLRCQAFEARKLEPPKPGNQKSNVPGIHDQTIVGPKK